MAVAQLDETGRVAGQFAIGDGGREYSVTPTGGTYGDTAFATMRSTAEPEVAVETRIVSPFDRPTAVQPQPLALTQRSCGSCGGGGTDATSDFTPASFAPAALTDTRIDAGITVGWLELLLLLVALGVARYSELI